MDLRMTNASILSILAHATPTLASRSKGQSRGAGAYCGGHLAAQLVVFVVTVIHFLCNY